MRARVLAAALVAVVSVCSVVVHGLSLESATYRSVNMSAATESQSVTVLHLVFDAPLHFGGKQWLNQSVDPLTWQDAQYHLPYSAPYSYALMCAGSQEEPCLEYPPALYPSFGLVQITCPNGFNTTNDGRTRTIPVSAWEEPEAFAIALSGLHSLPPSRDPLHSLGIGIGLAEGDEQGLVFNALSLMLVHEKVFEDTPIPFPVTPRGDDLASCTIRIREQNAFGVPVTGPSGDGLAVSEARLQPYTLPECVPSVGMQSFGTLFSVGEALEVESNFTTTTRLLWSSAYQQNQVDLLSCEMWVKSYLQTNTTSAMVLSSGCVHPYRSVEWFKDPCCTLQNTRTQCCGEVPRQLSVTRFLEPEVTRLSQCNDTVGAQLYLQGLASVLNEIDDPVRGCRARDKGVKRGTSLSQIQSLVDDCLSYLALSATAPCVSDDDCICTSQCDGSTGRCVADVYDGANCFARCLVDRMPDDLYDTYRIVMDLSGEATDEDFLSNFTARFQADGCEGPYLFYDEDDIGVRTRITEEVCNTHVQHCWPPVQPLHEAPIVFVGDPCDGASAGVCTACDRSGDSCRRLQANAGCFFEVASRAECTLLKGRWTSDDRCATSAQLTREQCECGATTDSGRLLCSTGYCELPGVKEAQCTTLGDTACLNTVTWHDELQSCQLVGIRPIVEVCRAYGGHWVGGHHWEAERWNSESQCIDTCMQNGLLRHGDCANRFECTGKCPRCESTILPGGLCYTDTSIQTDTCDCFAIGGERIGSTGLCALPLLSQQQCTALKYKWAHCEQVTSQSRCEREITPFPSELGLACQWNEEAQCRNEAECEQGGRCFGMEEFPRCLAGASSPADEDNPVCLKCPASERCYPRLECTFGQCIKEYGCSSVFGCVDAIYSSEDALECHTRGGTFAEKATTPEACAAFGNGCVAPSETGACSGEGGVDFTTNGMLPRSPEVCVACGGEVKPVYEWRNFEWRPVTQLPLKWITERQTSLHTYGSVFDIDTAIDDFISQSVSAPALFLAAEIECRYDALSEALQTLSCDCTGVSHEERCYPVGGGAASLGTSRFCFGRASVGTWGTARLELGSRSVLASQVCIAVKVSLLGVQQFRLDGSVSQSGTDTLGQVLSGSVNEYSVIVNSHGQHVGQIVADGVRISITALASGADDDEVASSKAVEVFSSEDVPLLCASKSPSVDLEDSWTLYGLAELDVSPTGALNWTVVGTNGTLLEDGETYCHHINASGAFFLIRLRTNWEANESVFAGQEEVRILLYIVAGVFFVLMVLDGISVANHVRIQLRFQLSLQIAVLGVLFVHAAVRGVYFVLYGSEKVFDLEADAPAAYLIVAELPNYLFYTAYSLLIFFWASISRKTTMDTNFLSALRVPFLLVNAGLYVLFIIVIILNETLSDSKADSFNKVYKVILATLALVTAIFFWVYGGSIMKRTIQGARLRAGQGAAKATSAMFKIFGILVICTIGLLFQCVYLLYIAWADPPSIGVVFAVFIVTELIPSALLLIILFSPPNSGKSSRGSTRGSTRGHSSGKHGSSGTTSGGSSGDRRRWTRTQKLRAARQAEVRALNATSRDVPSARAPAMFQESSAVIRPSAKRDDDIEMDPVAVVASVPMVEEGDDNDPSDSDNNESVAGDVLNLPVAPEEDPDSVGVATPRGVPHRSPRVLYGKQSALYDSKFKSAAFAGSPELQPKAVGNASDDEVPLFPSAQESMDSTASSSPDSVSTQLDDGSIGGQAPPASALHLPDRSSQVAGSHEYEDTESTQFGEGESGYGDDDEEEDSFERETESTSTL